MASSAVKGVNTYTKDQSTIKEQMAANSAAWFDADASTREKLHKDNVGLAKQLGSGVGYDDASGNWSGSADHAVTTLQNQYNVAGAKYKTPTLRGLDLGDMYGLNYNYKDILGLLNAATNAAYDVERSQAQQNENKFYSNLLSTQNSALDTLRKAQAASVATGASRGLTAAQELSAVLGLQDVASQEATQLAAERTQVNEKQTAALTQNASNALNTSNAVKEAIANLAATLYGYDTQGSIGVLDYLAALSSTAANTYSADKTLEGVKYNADQNLAGTVAAANVSSSGRSSGSGGSSGYSGGSGSYSGGDSTSNTTTGEASSVSTEKEVISLPGTNSYMEKEADGTYTLYSPDSGGSYSSPKTGLSEADMQAIKREGTPEALNANYPTKTTGTKIVDGTTRTYGRNATYRYSAVKKGWVGPDGRLYSTAHIVELDAKYNVPPDKKLYPDYSSGGVWGI